jgi:biopolymer transport protein ExbD
MKFPRNSRILRSQFDVAPIAAVFFLLVIFVLVGALMPIPGLHMRLNPPSAENLPGTSRPSIAVAVDANGNYYFENQLITEPRLKNSLLAASKGSREPLTLVIHADKAVTYDQLLHLTLLARDPDPAVSITNIVLATLPRVTDAPIPK